MRRFLALITAGTAASAALVLAGAVPASAHVTVNPKEAAQGGYAKIAFRVPNERDSAETTKVEVALPVDQPIKSVSLRPVPGWTGTVDKTNGTATRITWTAEPGNAVKPGQFQEFEVSMGPLPKVEQLVFKALQTYSSGEVVRWIDEPGAGAEPEHPAPVLKLTASAADTTGAHGAATGAPSVAARNAALGSEADDDDVAEQAGTWLGAGGLVLGAAALVLAFLAVRRSRA